MDHGRVIFPLAIFIVKWEIGARPIFERNRSQSERARIPALVAERPHAIPLSAKLRTTEHRRRYARRRDR